MVEGSNSLTADDISSMEVSNFRHSKSSLKTGQSRYGSKRMGHKIRICL